MEKRKIWKEENINKHSTKYFSVSYLINTGAIVTGPVELTFINFNFTIETFISWPAVTRICIDTINTLAIYTWTACTFIYVCLTKITWKKCDVSINATVFISV